MTTALAKRDLEFLATISDVIQAGDRSQAIALGRNITRAIHLGGVAQAKYLWEMEQVWGTEGFESDSSFAEVAEVDLGIPLSTYNKYTAMWSWLKDYPAWWNKPVRGLLLLNAAMREQQLNKTNLKKVEKANTVEEIHAIVREVRGHKTRSKSALYLLLGADGTLMARFGADDTYTPVGWIHIEADQTKDDYEAISKLLDAVVSRFESAGVQVMK